MRLRTSSRLLEQGVTEADCLQLPIGASLPAAVCPQQDLPLCILGRYHTTLPLKWCTRPRLADLESEILYAMAAVTIAKQHSMSSML